jgi:Family of unknown function (DUF6057)
LTVEAFLIFLVSRHLAALTRNSAHWGILLLPLLVVPWMLNRYEVTAWNITLGLLLSLATAAGWFLVPTGRLWARMICGWAIMAALCWVAGLWPYLCFLSAIAIIEFQLRPNLFRLGGLLLPGLILPIYTAWSLGGHGVDYLHPWGSGADSVSVAVFFFFVPLVLAVLTRLPKPAVPVPTASDCRTKKTRAMTPGQPWNFGKFARAFTMVMLVAGWGWVCFCFDKQQKCIRKIDYCSGRGDYKQVLAWARQLKGMSPSTEAHLLFALWKEGQLLDNLFSFQIPEYAGVFPGLVPHCESQVQPLMEVGLVGDAEHYAIEAMEIGGNRPALLLQLAQINILKGRPQAARIFLNVLGQMPFERNWARLCLRQMDADPMLQSDALISHVRPLMLTNDIGYQAMMPGPLLQHLLRANSHNRMAFEYLTAHYLLNQDLDQLARQIGRLDDLGYTGIPRHYEEALLLLQQSKNVQLDLHGRNIRPETIERYQRFRKAAQNLQAASPDGQDVVARDFGDTYWFYCLRENANTQPPR